MILRDAVAVSPKCEVRVHSGRGSMDWVARLESLPHQRWPVPLSRHPAWMVVLQQGLKHTAYCLEAVQAESTCGFLALAYVRSLLFGRLLVSLPYLNYGGI